MRIFGREPTVIIQSIAAALAILVSFGFKGLSAEQAGLIIAAIWAVLGAVNALATRPVAPALFISAVGAVAAVLTSYGLHVTQEQTGSIAAGLVSVIVLLTRVQVTPITDPRPSEQVVG